MLPDLTSNRSARPRYTFCVKAANNAGGHLERLEVSRLATIEALTLELSGGLSVFTGETGAGKSIIVDALGLLLGARASSDLVRTGEADLLVTGFWQEESASRRVTVQGRSTARLSGEVVTLRELSDFAEERLTIHWQHSAQSLLSPARQRALLDDRAHDELRAYERAYAAWRAAGERLERLRASERERARQLDLLTYQAQEIAAVNPQEGEEEPLRAELDRLSNLDLIASGASDALALLAGEEVSAQGLVGDAVRALTSAARYEPNVAQLQRELREALSALEAVAGELRDVADASAPDPEELARVEQRLAQLAKLQTKYGPNIADVLRYQAELTAQLQDLHRDESDAGSLEGELRTLQADVMASGRALAEARRAVAAPLAEQLEGVIRQLGMPHARLTFSLDALTEPGPHGLEEVRVLFSANPGEDAGPLASVASGGELSRVMLAISTVTGAHTPSVVFDEVDAGVGGAAALAVAAQLAALSRDRQVMVVTHLAQIAARADHHFKVEKALEDGRTVTRVRELRGPERLEEIARMLSGDLSEAALRHARELVEGGRKKTASRS